MSLVRCDSWERPLAGGKGPKLFGLTLFSGSPSSRGGPGEPSAGPGSPLFINSPRSQPSSPGGDNRSLSGWASSPFAAVAAARAASLTHAKSLRRQSSGISRFASEAQAAAAAAAELAGPSVGPGLGGKLNSLSSSLSLPRGLSLASSEELPSLPGSADFRCADDTDSGDSATQSFPSRQSDTSNSQDVADSGYLRTAPRKPQSPGPASPRPGLPPMAHGASGNLLQALSKHRISQPEWDDVPTNRSAGLSEFSSPAHSGSSGQSNPASTGASTGQAAQQQRRKAFVRIVETGMPSYSQPEPTQRQSNSSSGRQSDLRRGMQTHPSPVFPRESSPAAVTSGATYSYCGSRHRPKRKATVSPDPDSPQLGSSPSPSPSPSPGLAVKVQKKLGRKKLDRKPCRVCGILDTPQWRQGPDGKRNLCNKCGVRLRKGLLPLPLPPYPSSSTGADSGADEGDLSAPSSPQ